jgi:carbonic anhydrase
MKKSILLFVILLSANCGSSYAADWSYDGSTGPKHWGSLEQDFATCKTGKQQTPVNIATQHVQITPLPAIQTFFNPSLGKMINNGHTIQMSLVNGGGMIFDHTQYQLVQFHFHTPSETEINGKHFPMEAHLVFESAKGNAAVIAVFFQEGDENKKLNDIFSHFPIGKGESFSLTKPFNAGDLLPRSLAYYTFPGSLTTPPCGEGVTWYVLKDPVDLSAEQIKGFKAIFKKNARPVQRLNGRVIETNG